MYGESLLSGQVTNADDTPMSGDMEGSEASDPLHEGHGRATRSGGRTAPVNGSRKRKHIDTYNSLDDMSDEDDAASSGNDWDGGDDDEVDDNLAEEDEDEMSVDDDDDDNDLDSVPRSLIVKLKVGDQRLLQHNSASPKSITKPEPPQSDEKKLPDEMLAQLPALSHHAEAKSALNGASVKSIIPGSSEIVGSISETTLEKPVSGEHPAAYHAPPPQASSLTFAVSSDIEHRGHVPAPTINHVTHVPASPQGAQTNGYN